MTQHNYTQDPVHTAAAAVNAGTCLEDGNGGDTTFSHLEEAYNQVISYMYKKYFIVVALVQKLVNESTLRDCASRLFMTRMVLGEFDPLEMNPYSK